MPEPIEDDFGKYFDQLDTLATEKKSVPADFGKAADVPVPETPVASVVEDTPTPDTLAADVTAEPATGADDAVPAVADSEPAAAKPATDDILERLVQTLDKRAPPAPPVQRQQPPPPPPLYTDDEISVLSQFQKDWPEQAQAIQLMLRGATVQTQQDILGRVGQVLERQQQTVQTVAADQQLSFLHAAIPDYDEVADPVIQWARTDKAIPGYLRAAYENVITNGDVREIKHLVDTWRTATGKSVTTPAVAQTAKAPAKPANELSEAAKQAAASLAPVTSKRTAVVTTATPQDYESAFDHWTAAKA